MGDRSHSGGHGGGASINDGGSGRLVPRGLPEGAHERVPLLAREPARGGGGSGGAHWFRRPKLRSIFLIGLLSTSYAVAEITLSLVLHSLVMFSDGLHNLSDGLALAVAFWAEKKKLEAGAEGLTCVVACARVRPRTS